MEITASSTYDLKEIKALSRNSMFRKFNPKVVMLLFGILYVFILLTCIPFILLAADTASDNKILILTFLILIPCFFSFSYFVIPYVQYKSLGKFSGIKNTYTFKDHEIVFESHSENYSGSGIMKYEMLFKVIETREYLFIYQTRNLAYIVDKSTVANGSVEDLRKHMRSLLGKKYIIRNY